MNPRLRASQLFRENISHQAREGGNNSRLWSTMWNSIFNTSQRFTQGNNPAKDFEIDLHDLWFVLIQAGMHIDYDHPEQDRLVTQVLSAKEMGLLVRRGNSMEVTEEAVVSDGRIWKDLPFFASDLTDYWVREHGNMGADERKNLAALMAKLNAVGAGGNTLSACALIVLRDTLETDRPLTSDQAASEAPSEGGQEKERRGQRLSIADLLPATNMWLINADVKILQLCDDQTGGLPPDVGKLGGLAEAAGVIPAKGQFSPARWQFWLKRLEEISMLSNEVQGVSRLAGQIMNSMLLTATRIDTVMKRDLAQSGKLPG